MTSQTVHSVLVLIVCLALAMMLRVTNPKANDDKHPSPTTTTTSVAATTTTSPPQPRLLWGAYIDGDQTFKYYAGTTRQDAPWDTKTWDRFETDAGKRLSVLHYGQPAPWDQPFEPGVASIVQQRGAYVLMDMDSGSTPLVNIANGVYDSSITTWARAVKSWGYSLFLRWDWEMNASWFKWGAQAQSNPARFIAAWRHFHDVVVAAGAHNVTWVWCPNVGGQSRVPIASLYPGDAFVDWTCLDGYNYAGPWTSFDATFHSSYDTLQQIAPSKPVMIGETATVETGGDKARWISDMFAALPSMPNIRALVWFNWLISGCGSACTWPIESSSATQQAFQAGIQNPMFVTNTVGTLTDQPISAP
jgi:hypothetical protein